MSLSLTTGSGEIELNADELDDSKVVPTRGMLLIEAEERPERTKGGILLAKCVDPMTGREVMQNYGIARVLAVGAMRPWLNGYGDVPTKLECAEGDRIIFIATCAHVKFTHNGRKLTLLDQDDVKAVLEPTTEPASMNGSSLD